MANISPIQIEIASMLIAKSKKDNFVCVFCVTLDKSYPDNNNCYLLLKFKKGVITKSVAINTNGRSVTYN